MHKLISLIGKKYILDLIAVRLKIKGKKLNSSMDNGLFNLKP
jgi:hypothetical protein